MSSILEALRELESDRPKRPGQQTTVAGAPREPQRGSEAWIPLVGGLAVGVVVFGAVVWATGIFSPTSPAPAHDSSVQAGAAEQARAPEPARAAAPAHPPAWLDAAEAPRARVSGTPTPAPAAPEAARAPQPVVETPAPAPAAPAAERRRRTEPTGSSQVDVLSLAYSPNVEQRTVTLRVNGRPVTLHQRDSAGGVEVQLIMRDGVYLRRGADVYFTTPIR